MGQISDEVMERTEGTDPTAEEPAEYYGQYDGSEGPEERPVELVSSQDSSNCNEWVKLQEPVDGPGTQLPEFFSDCGDYTEPSEEREKECLAYASDCNNFHNHTFKAVKVFDL